MQLISFLPSHSLRFNEVHCVEFSQIKRSVRSFFGLDYRDFHVVEQAILKYTAINTQYLNIVRFERHCSLICLSLSLARDVAVLAAHKLPCTNIDMQQLFSQTYTENTQ